MSAQESTESMQDQPLKGHPSPIGQPYPVWKTLFGGIARPARYLALDGNERRGPTYFYLAYTYYSLTPMLLLNLLIVALDTAIPGVFRFHDISPMTMVYALPIQLLLGPVFIAVMATCMRLGLTITSLVPEEDAGPILKTGWYVGTVYVCLYSWWLGILVALASIDAAERSLDVLVPATLLLGVIALLRVMMVAYHRNSPHVEGGKWGRVVGGVMIGSVLFLIVSSILGLILQLVLRMVLEMG